MKKIKLLLLFIFFSSVLVFGQAEYVPADHLVYPFLERMEALGLIEQYNSFEIPKTRKQIAGYISDIKKEERKLNQKDREYLDDLFVEFEYDIKGTLNESSKLFGGEGYNPLSDKEKYLYYTVQPGKGNLFINLLAQGEGIYYRNPGNQRYKSFLGVIGGELRGTIIDKFGFHLRGTNGNAFGDKEAALRELELQSNFKFNETPQETFFDNAEGYITADFDAIRFKLGRDRIKLGYSSSLNLVDNHSPEFDYIGMDIQYGIFEYSYLHAKLLGRISFQPDSVTNGSFEIAEKYLGYHRLGFNISRYFNFGIGEFIIYGERPLDLAYLNPFNFYKSAEHSGKDRDNSMLFLDINSNPVKGTKLYGTFLIDDIKFSEIGKGWYGNQILFNAGVYTNPFYYTFPLELRFEYQHVEPYVFTHRLIRNNFTNSGYMLGRNTIPNSELFFTELKYTLTYRCFALIDFSYRIHGTNPVNADNTIINVGGDINLGYRTFDSQRVHFLDGDLEYARITGATVSYEPVNNIFFTLRLNYYNTTLKMTKTEYIESFFSLSVKI